MKGFKITDGKGFAVTFENGFTVSVQFGYGNYGDNYYDPEHSHPETHSQRNARLGERGSRNAETAIIGPDGEFINYKDGDVQGHQSPAAFLETMNYASKLGIGSVVAA